MLEEDKQRIIRNYEKIIDSLLDVKAKANLRLELERRLAENDALARKRYAQWETERKALTEECQQLAKEYGYFKNWLLFQITLRNDSFYFPQKIFHTR